MTVAFTDKDLPSLPDTWRWVPLCNVATIGSRQVLPLEMPEKSFNYMALENIESGTGQIVNFSPTLGKDIKSNKFFFDREHVLYGKLRPYLRKAVTPDFEGVSATDLLPIKPDSSRLNRYFLKWWLLSPVILDYVTRRQTGVKMPRLRSDDLNSLPIPLPPIEEQGLIVDKLASLNAQIRTARAAFDQIPALLKVFRRSVLAVAFRGELTERHLSDEPAAVLLKHIQSERRQRCEESRLAKEKGSAKVLYEDPLARDTSMLLELPEGWVWTKIGVIGDVSGGLTKNANREKYPLRYPYISVANVYADELRLNEISEIGVQETEIERTLLQQGDLLVVEGNGSVDQIGRAAIWDGRIENCLHQNHIIKVRFCSNVEPRFMLYWLLSPAGREAITRVASSTSGLYTLSISKIADLPVPLPMTSEQKGIVIKLDAFFEQSSVIENFALRSSHQLDDLEQSTLARAFRGEL